MFEQLRANRLPINHLWKRFRVTEKKNKADCFLSGRVCSPSTHDWLSMTQWSNSPGLKHTHKINLRLSLFCLVKENTTAPAATPPYITSAALATSLMKELIPSDWFKLELQAWQVIVSHTLRQRLLSCKITRKSIDMGKFCIPRELRSAN